MKKLSYFLFICGLIFSFHSKAQSLIKDHEGNEYEVSTLSDGRKWMVEGLRVKTDLNGNPIKHYYNTHAGKQSENAAALRYGYAYTVETLFSLPAVYSKYPDFTPRSRGLCPKGYYVPELLPFDLSFQSDYAALLRAYNGIPTWWSSNANWGDFMNALRISFGDGVSILGSSADGDPGKYNILKDKQGNDSIVISGWSMLHSSGPVEHDRTLGLNLATSTPGSTAGGVEYIAAGRAAYCRCVENKKINVTFENLSDLSVTVKLSDSLRWNSYDAREAFTRICKENFKIVEIVSQTPIAIDAVEISIDAKSFQIFAPFDEQKGYQLTFLDARLSSKGFLMGGYTFNNELPLTFGTTNSLSSIETANISVYNINNILHIETDRVVDVVIYNTVGMEVMRSSNVDSFIQLNTSSLTKGVYVVKLLDRNTASSLSAKIIQ